MLFFEQFTDIQENVEALYEESVTEITEVQETSVEIDDVKGGDFEPTVPSSLHG